MAAMAAVPRERFVPPESAGRAWDDCALPLACGSTISQPAMVALVLEELQLSAGMRVLEIGSGCGYLLALIHAMGGEVTGVEIDERLAAASQELLAKQATVMAGDASKLDLSGPFDRVVFSASVDSVPDWAMGLLGPEGFVLAPVGGPVQELERWHADGKREQTGRLCRFVPFR